MSQKKPSRASPVEPAPAPSRAEQRRAVVAREIVEAGRALVTQQGAARVTLEAVGERLGLTKAALYYYFPSKEALLVAVGMADLVALAEHCHQRTAVAADGPGALEALIRATVEFWAGRLEMFRLIFHGLDVAGVQPMLSPEQLSQVHSINDRTFGPTQDKLQADIKAGRLPRHPHPRRLAFTAQLAAFGLLSMKAMVERQDDPLGYSDEILVVELCRAFRAAAERGAR